MSKKKFKDRKIGKLLTSKPVKGLLKSIPLVGPIAGNVLDEVDQSEPGSINKKDIVPIIIQTIAAIVLLYMVYKGHISMEEAEQAKEFITD